MTPLVLKNKKRGTGVPGESHMQTPSMLIPNRTSKFLSKDMSSAMTPSILGASRITTGSNKSILSLNTKSKILKRKSRTPGGQKNRRKSKLIAQAAQDAVNQSKMTNINETASSTTSTATNQTTKQSLYASTLSNASSTRSNLSSTSARVGSVSKISTTSTSSLKHPPVSASAKFAANYNSAAASNKQNNHLQIERMTSTASNTFIEEESYIENNNPKKMHIAQAAALKINQLVGACNDVNYLEFSRDLSKQKSTSSSALSDASNKFGAARSGLSKAPSLKR
jgi:hypothetical protein